MAKLDLAFQLTANANGMAAGVAQADRELSKVGASAQATSAEFRQAAKITQELRTPTEKYADTVGKLDKMMQKGLLSQEVYGRAVAKADAELKAATSSMDEMASAASMAERVVNGLSGAIGGIAEATKSVSEAGIAVIKFGKDIAWTYLQWKVFSAIRNPAGFKDFAVSALKTAATARTAILAAKALGIGLGVAGGSAGVAASALLGLSNPLVGGALLAINLGRAFLGAKDRAYEMAAGITEGRITLEQLNAELGQVQAQQVDNLAFAMEEATAAGERSEKAFSGLGDVFVTPFVGAFAAIQSGLAGLTDGISGVIEGVTSIMSPIAQVIAPVFTLLGTLVEGVLKFIGVLGEAIGVVLKVAGAVTHTFLSPFIVGLSNVVEAIRSGMNAAFEFIGSRIDWVSQKIKDFYAFMSKVPIIGRAFASGEKPAAQAAAGVAAAAPVDDGAEKARKEASDAMAKQDAEDEQRQQRAISRQTDQFFEATKAAEKFGDEGRAAAEQYQSGLQDLNQQLEDGRINEETYNREAEKRRQTYNDQIKGIEERNAAEKKAADDAAREQEQAAKEAERAQEEAAKEAERRAKEAAAIDEKMADKQADIDKVNAERAAALGGKSNEALKANDVRSSEGMSQFLALATGREDPAIAEYRKQTQKLDEIRAELRALQQEKVDILGAAA